MKKFISVIIIGLLCSCTSICQQRDENRNIISPSHVSTELSKTIGFADITLAIEPYLESINNIYERYYLQESKKKIMKSKLAGKVVFLLNINPEGGPVSASIVYTDIENEVILGELIKYFSKIEFPKFPGNIVTVEYPIDLIPPC